MPSFPRSLALGLVLLTACGCFSGCGALVTPTDSTSNGNNAAFDTGPNLGKPNNEQVLVRFANATRTEAVDVQFFVSYSRVENLPDDLFSNDHNKVTSSVGVAGSSLITPGSGDQILIDCSPTLVIGTKGGDFKDAESGEDRGQGEPRWVQDEGLGICGGTVTFIYLGDGQNFQTRITVE